MSRNPYLAASRPSTSYTRSSRTSGRTGGLVGGAGSGTGLLGRSRSSAALGNLASHSTASSPFGSTLSAGSYVPTWQRSSSTTRLNTSLASPSRTSTANTSESSQRSLNSARRSLYKSTSSHSLAADDGLERESHESDSHLKNYQESKLQQSQTPEATRDNRSSLASLDSDNNATTQSDSSRKSNTSLDSSASETTTPYKSFDDDTEAESIGDNIPSGSARHLRSQQQGQLSKSKSLEISASGASKQSSESSLLHGSMSVDRLLLRADSMGERDLRKSFKELVVENERLKQQLKGFDDKDKQRQQDWIRKERQLQRKISELEEESKQIEQWKQEIQRLKDENNSLIRVVSKLTKQHH